MGNPIPDEVTGPRLRLRLISPDDAEYVQGLRTDPTYNTHLSAVTGTAQDQRRWIEGYKAREQVGTEAYYVIERRDDERRCGLVRLYEIAEDRFTWGSWILDANKPSKAALESAVLIYEIGFEKLGLASAIFDVRRDNAHTLAFHRRFGATEVGQDQMNIYFHYPAIRYAADRARHLEVLTQQEQET
ncbi:MAG: N-acetyltransferase [Rhodobacteraceae bacterium]|nr:MAG: N-acetyltransferase [Paracoccaceae bacterium]